MLFANTEVETHFEFCGVDSITSVEITRFGPVNRYTVPGLVLEQLFLKQPSIFEKFFAKLASFSRTIDHIVIQIDARTSSATHPRFSCFYINSIRSIKSKRSRDRSMGSFHAQ